MTNRNIMAIGSIGLLTGYYLTKSIKFGLLVAIVIGSFTAGAAYQRYQPHISITD